METVLLGVCDRQLEPGETTDWKVSKVGSVPDWPAGYDVGVPSCGQCGQATLLVVQIYCPLADSPYHRSLHVFACPQRGCWNKSASWKVLRSQLKDSAYQEESHTTNNEAMFDTGWSDDEWGAVGDESTDKWGESGENCTKETAERMTVITSDHETVTAEENVNSNCNNEAAMPEEICDMTVSRINQQLAHVSLADDKCSGIRSLREMCQSHLASKWGTSVDTSETQPCDSTPFLGWYLGVIEEPPADCDSYQHEKQLLAAYLQQEDVAASDLLACPDTKTSSAEQYEKTAVQHQDKLFHKFMTRISRYPSQVVRYCYGGSPVLLSADTISPSSCSHCGSPRLFELQILPSLLPFLMLPNTDKRGSRLEFGTAAVFTCSTSCWREGSVTPVEEQVLLQAEPDQHLLSPFS